LEMVQKMSTSKYQTISEVSTLLAIPSHVLRFWETQFKQIKPITNQRRRLYSDKDIALIKEIKHLLYDKGYTIKGVQIFLKTPKTATTERNAIIAQAIEELERIYSNLKSG
jgi:DNA-binding transcriptional MerR regulator